MNSKFTKVLVCILFFFILMTISVSFFSNNKFSINSEMIICFSLLILLTLSERFDNFNIGKIITVSKNIKEIKKENLKIKDEFLNVIKLLTINNNNQKLSINFDEKKFEKNEFINNLEEKNYPLMTIIDNKSIRTIGYKDIKNNRFDIKTVNDFIMDEIDYLIFEYLINNKYGDVYFMK